jgi:hypothetical protein
VVAFAGIGVARAPDTLSWLRVDLSGAGIRLWAIPLFFKVLPADTLREVGQAAVSAVCWTGLAAVVALEVRSRWLKPAAFAVVLATGLVTQVTNWDTIILGESLAISVTVGAFAAWWLFVMYPTRLTLGLVVVGSVLWAFLRQSNLVLIAPIAVGVAACMAWVAWNRRRARRPIARDVGGQADRLQPTPPRMLAAILVVLIVILAWGLPEIPKNEFNHDENLATIYSERILPSPARVAWFAGHGMPATPDVRALAYSYFGRGQGRTPIQNNHKFFRWMQRHGASVYFLYLLTHPGYLFGVPITQAIGPPDNSSSPRAGPPVTEVLSGAKYGEIRQVLPEPVESLLFDSSGQLIALTVIAIVLAAVAFGVRGWTRRELVPGLAVVLSLAIYWLTFHAAASEPGRHNMLAAISIRVSLLVIGLLAVDQLWQARSARRRVGSAPGHAGSPTEVD